MVQGNLKAEITIRKWLQEPGERNWLERAGICVHMAVDKYAGPVAIKRRGAIRDMLSGPSDETSKKYRGIDFSSVVINLVKWVGHVTINWNKKHKRFSKEFRKIF